MKRSEMIDLIYETIYQHNKKSDITMYEMAELILDAQELAGMLPPGQDSDMVKMSTLNGEIISKVFEKHEWEDEHGD